MQLFRLLLITTYAISVLGTFLTAERSAYKEVISMVFPIKTDKYTLIETVAYDLLMKTKAQNHCLSYLLPPCRPVDNRLRDRRLPVLPVASVHYPINVTYHWLSLCFVHLCDLSISYIHWFVIIITFHWKLSAGE